MKAPDKLYIDVHDNLSDSFLYGFTEKRTGEDIEYIREDAFIEKAKEVFCKATCNGHPPRSTCTSLGTCKGHDNFVKYMKGE